MRSARIGLVVALLVGCSTQAHAGPVHFLKKLFGGQRATPTPKPRRAHLITEALAAHVKPETQQNLFSLAHYAGPVAFGSATVVGAWSGKPGKLRALVLTNHHVVAGNHDASTVISFMDGSQSTKSKIVAQSRLLDYALLEVELPDTVQIQPVKLHSDFLHAGEPIYAMGAATSMTDYKVRDFLSVQHGKELQATIDRGEMPEYRTLSTGKMLDDGPTYYRIMNKRRVFQQDTDLAITHGASGGPVFSSKTHELVALNASGGRDKTSSFAGVTTLPYIMYDIGKKLERNKIALRYQDTVGTLYESSQPAPTP